ncbi:MAG: hypothetical protein AMXMBFR66_00770 [Pseudomonadota bacterium]
MSWSDQTAALPLDRRISTSVTAKEIANAVMSNGMGRDSSRPVPRHRPGNPLLLRLRHGLGLGLGLGRTAA